MQNNRNKPTVAIIGAGWAGLSTGLWLAQQNRYNITIFEATRSIGGRARQVSWDGVSIDNGQHLLLGAYQSVTDTLQLAGVDINDLFSRAPFSWEMLDSSGNIELSFPASSLPWPFNLLRSFVSGKGLSKSELFKGLFVLHRMKSISLTNDISVKELLTRYGLANEWIRAFYNPLCLAALNVPTDIASAQLFIKTLKAAFLFRKGFADYLLPLDTLHHSFSSRLESALLAQNVDLLTTNKVIGIDQVGSGFSLKTQDSVYSADYVVIATPPKASAKLLKVFDDSFASMWDELPDSPISTVYLQYPDHVRLPKTFLGISNSSVDWFFDRSHCGQNGLISSVISATNNRTKVDDLALESHSVLQHIIPELPLPLKTKVCTEKNATFLATVGCEKLRPSNQTKHDGLYIAGDYTATGLPATLEGAVISGMSVANLINQNNKL